MQKCMNVMFSITYQKSVTYMENNGEKSGEWVGWVGYTIVM